MACGSGRSRPARSGCATAPPTTFGRNQGLPGDVVRALLQDRSGRFLVGLDGYGLAVRAPDGTFTTDPALDRLRTASIRALYDDGAGGVLIGSNEGLFRLLNGRLDTGAQPVLPALAEHPEPAPGSAGPPVGRHQPRPRAHRWRRLHARSAWRSEQLAASFITSIYQDEQDIVWVGSMAGGLSQVRGDELVPYAWPGQATPPHDVRAIAAGPHGSMWVSTTATVWRVRGNTAVASRSAQRPAERQGVCDPGRRGRHAVDDVEQGPARRDASATWTRLPTAVSRCCRRGCSARPTGW